MQDELIYHLLDVIAAACKAIGAGAVCLELGRRGLVLSEATVGRLLRQLDRMGYTRREGFQGRVLTPAGQAHLGELRAARQRAQQGWQFMNVIETKSQEELMEVLVARRGMEREIARLAAMRATSEDLAAIQPLLEKQEALARWGIGLEEDDLHFHKLLARTARNRVLEAAVDLIRQDHLLTIVLNQIRQQLGADMARDHRRIFDAVAAHRSDLAEEAMVAHIDNLLAEVERYWTVVRGGRGQEPRDQGSPLPGASVPPHAVVCQ